jgi:hypothetical protein
MTNNIINKGKNFVPEKTIIMIPNDFNVKVNDVLKIIKSFKGDKKRNWFPAYAYRCLPLTVGNQQGFYITTEYDFSFHWDGGEDVSSTTFDFYEEDKVLDTMYPRIDSHFGSGIITISLPIHLRTPPKVNLMTINPPNVVLPNITVLTGVVESDNLRRDFTFNLKIQMPNIKVKIPAGTPLAGFIPIPRYYCDEFSLKNAEDIFSKDLVKKEIDSYNTFTDERDKRVLDGTLFDKYYMHGVDAYGNKFDDHQRAGD